MQGHLFGAPDEDRDGNVPSCLWATCFATEVAMSKGISANGNKTPEPLPETPFTTFVQLDGKSSTPSQFKTPGTFTIIRLQTPAGLSERIMKLSPVPALLLSVSA